MGSRGHAFISHTKGLSPRPQAGGSKYGLPDHPVTVRPGQRYWPRRGRARVGFVVKRVSGDTAICHREDGDPKPLRIPVERLLATRADGQGAYEQFIGFRPRLYDTFACVHEVGDSEAVLCFPEWHPRAPVGVFTSLVPEESRRPGAWLALRCNLSAASGARLQPHEIVPAEDPGPERIARPGLD